MPTAPGVPSAADGPGTAGVVVFTAVAAAPTSGVVVFVCAGVAATVVALDATGALAGSDVAAQAQSSMESVNGARESNHEDDGDWFISRKTVALDRSGPRSLAFGAEKLCTVPVNRGEAQAGRVVRDSAPMNKTTALALFIFSVLAACQSTPASLAEKVPPHSGLLMAEMDLKANPSQDFYRYVNGGWLDANPVPADEALWGVFSEVKKRNDLVLQQVLEESASKPSNDLNRKLGDFYASGMDEAAIESQGARPLEKTLKAIDALDDLSKLPTLLAHLHTAGSSGFFSLRSGADLTDANMTIAFITQDGMGLPEKDYYLRDKPESVELRKKYQAHIATMLGLLGEAGESAVMHAMTVLAIETELAKSSFGAVDFRDPKKRLNKITVASAQALTPHFDWSAYLHTLELDPAQPINLIAPDYFKRMDELLTSRPLEDWKVYPVTKPPDGS